MQVAFCPIDVTVTYLLWEALFSYYNKSFFAVAAFSMVIQLLVVAIIVKMALHCEPASSKRFKLACTPIKDSDQPAHPQSDHSL